MARGGIGRFVVIGLGLGAAAYYGVLGRDAQAKIQDILHGGRVALGPGSPINGSSSYGPTGTGGYTGPNGQHNPNFWQQAREWQAQARSKDWGSFRQHVMAIGAPDPGPSAPAGW